MATGVERQPTRSKRIREDRRFDKTQLKMSGHGRTVHRDYASHALRWNYVAEQLTSPQKLALHSWVAGLVDGEGCFDIAVRDDEGQTGRQVLFHFRLGLRADDRPTIELLRNILKIGSIYEINKEDANPGVSWAVFSRGEIRTLREFFREVPLRSKKRFDFEEWAEAFDYYEANHSPRERITDELYEEMKKRSQWLRDGRKYVDGKPFEDGDHATYLQDVFFKYGWTHRQLEHGLSILDVGCGQEQPLLYVIGARKDLVPDCYLGVDMNRILKKSRVRWAEIWDEFDFVSNWQKILTKYTPFDVAVCFEVIEHMAVADGAKLLAGLYGCLRPGGVAYLSTPVFNGLAAANHIHEYTVAELQAAILDSGFRIERRLGTFASKLDIKDACLNDGDVGKHRWDVYQDLERWFGGEVMATFMAPLYPDHSRNNMWVLVRPPEAG